MNKKLLVVLTATVLWVLNLMTAIVQHLAAGPGKVIPTPFQRFVAMALAPQYGAHQAVQLSNAIFVWGSVGFALVLFAYLITERRSRHPA